MSNPFDQPNPYVSPQQASWGAPPVAAAPVSRRLPVLCTVMFWVDIVFSVLRIFPVAGAVWLLSQGNAMSDEMVARTAVPEIIAGLGMVVFGLTGDVMMLLKQRWGAYVAWLKIASVLGSIGVAIWQSTYVLERFPAGSPTRVGGIIGAVLSLGVRTLLLLAFTAAVVLFLQWSKEQASRLSHGRGAV